MADYLIKGVVTNVLNMAPVSAYEAPILKPYMKLVSLLGGFLGQVHADGLDKVVVELDGKVALLESKSIVAAILAGLLGLVMELVNM